MEPEPETITLLESSALSSIYPTFSIHTPQSWSLSLFSSSHNLLLNIELPDKYPDASPAISLSLTHDNNNYGKEEERFKRIINHLNKIIQEEFIPCMGRECVFDIACVCQEVLDNIDSISLEDENEDSDIREDTPKEEEDIKDIKKSSTPVTRSTFEKWKQSFELEIREKEEREQKEREEKEKERLRKKGQKNSQEQQTSARLTGYQHFTLRNNNAKLVLLEELVNSDDIHNNDNEEDYGEDIGHVYVDVEEELYAVNENLDELVFESEEEDD